MSSPYIGEIRMFAGNFPPSGWAFCNGQLMPIDQNTPLYQLIGTTYGGDGQVTFALPNLQSRVPLHMGSGPGLTPRTIGETGGVETVTLTTQQMPAHNHAFVVSKDQAGNTNPSTNLLGQIPGGNVYIFEGADTALNAGSIGTAGGSQPHDNMTPFLCINFILSLFGLYPTPT